MAAAAEARAAWHRTANRCLVQEDARRAPKLAPAIKQADTDPTTPTGRQDVPITDSLPSNRYPSFSNLSPNSIWWLHLPPSYGYQQGLIGGNNETSLVRYISGVPVRNKDNPELSDQASYVESPFDDSCQNFTCDERNFTYNDEDSTVLVGRNCQDHLKPEMEKNVLDQTSVESPVCCEFSKNAKELCLDSETSWIRDEKSIPWWRTADTEELTLLLAQSSLDHVENCDLPRPHSIHVKKELNADVCYSVKDGIYASSLHPKTGVGTRDHLSTLACTRGSLTPRSTCRKPRMSAEDGVLPVASLPLRDSPTLERTSELVDDANKAQLLEALRHSQTRAREAERVAKLAHAEKERVFKLGLIQASHLFAYEQWLQLLQLKNMQFQFRTNDDRLICPLVLPWVPNRRSQKTRRNRQKVSVSKRRAKHSHHHRTDACKYKVVFALGLGLVGAGLLLGWTIGWMLSTASW